MLDAGSGIVEEWLSEFKLLEPVCHQLFEFYRSGEELLLQFTLQFLPQLIWCYLAVSASKDLQSSGCIEALLLGVYNLEIVDKQGNSRILSFTIPSLSKPSVYHEPSSIGSMALTEGALSQHGLSRVVYSGPHMQREMLTAQNRFEVLTFLLLRYNAALSYMPAVSLQSLCQICSRICVCGYPRQQVRKYRGINSRIPVSSEFMVQMLTGIYYAFYNGEWDLARKAMDDVLYRAQLELYPEPLLVANAIKASLPQGAIKSNKEGTKCIQVEITPTASRISRNAVTSMSIRGHRWKRHGNELGIPEEELIEVSEVDEGFYSRATSTSHSISSKSSSNTSNKTIMGKSQRRPGGNKVGGKEKDMSAESYKEHLSYKQSQRALSENLELLSLKRLTLTSSQSLPKSGSHSLARTSTTLFSKSFEQVCGGMIPSNHNGTETNRLSVCSLQEGNLIFETERIDLMVPNKQSNQQRLPTISITVSTDQ
ncbi:hyccin isoform X2 [Thamnophis elegans]|uniref:hyccin isoform X2 n=1 Tax=Thamnophis elegans TaxID=35005 RepID=UPI00137908E1|nr:hyccin isoform X2 [Thamnophis elegans]